MSDPTICLPLFKVSESPFSLAAAGDLAQLKEAEFTAGLTDQNGCTLLHYAARNGHLFVMQYLIGERGLDIDSGNSEGDTSLHLAIKNGEIKAMDLLLACGADPTIPNCDRATSVELAVRGSNPKLLEAFLSHNSVDILAEEDKKQTVLHVVAEGGLTEQARVIVSSRQFEKMVRKASSSQSGDNLLTRKNDFGMTPLHLGARTGSHNVLSLMLKMCKEYGLLVEKSLNCMNEDDCSPLHIAVDSGQTEVVKVLLEYGASPLAVMGQQPPPLHLACFQERVDIVCTMAEHCGGEILNHKDCFGKAPLHYSISVQGCSVIAYIATIGYVDVNVRDVLGRTPLHLAVLSGNVDSVKQLVDSGADLFLKDDQDLSMLHFAVMSGQLNVLNYLLRLPNVPEATKEVNTEGDNPFHLAIKQNTALCDAILKSTALEDVRDAEGNCYIHLASATGNVTLLREILRIPSYLNSLNDANRKGETPLHLAADNGYDKCVKLLLNFGALTHKCLGGMTAFFHACRGGHVNCAKILLDHFPFQKDWTDNRGNSALHYAVQSNNPLILKFLLDQGSKISLNNSSQSFFEVAVDKEAADLVKTVLDHDRWEESLDCNSTAKPHPMLHLIGNMPEAAKLVLDRCHEYATLDKSHPKYWEKFNFKYLQLKPISGGKEDGVSYVPPSTSLDLEAARGAREQRISRRDSSNATVHVLLEMIKQGQTNLLNHPVVNAYIKTKWNTYGIWMYLFFFVLRFILAVLVSMFTVLVLNADRTSQSSGSGEWNDSMIVATVPTVSIGAQVVRVLALIFNLALFLHLLLPVISVGLYIFNYVENSALWIYGVTIISNFVFLLTPNPLIVLPAGALACFFSWVMVLVALGFFDIFGIYVRMFLRVTRTVLQVLVLSLSLLFAFSFAFYVLAGSTPGFSTVSYSLVSVFHYMLGDFQQEGFIAEDIEGRLGNRGWVFLFLCLMTILLSIVMANLLIGLAVGDIEKFKANATIEKKKVLISYFSHVDKIPLLKRFQSMSYVRYPNAKVSKIRHIWRTLWRAAKEDAICEEEDSDNSHFKKILSTDEKLDYIIERLDQLTATVQHLQETH